MSITEVLQAKQQEIRAKGLPEQVVFSSKEINTLADVVALRKFKMTTPGYENFEISRNVLDCVRRVCLEDSLFLVLEFCVRRNIALVFPVSDVMPKFNEKEINYDIN